MRGASGAGAGDAIGAAGARWMGAAGPRWLGASGARWMGAAGSTGRGRELPAAAGLPITTGLRPASAGVDARVRVLADAFTPSLATASRRTRAGGGAAGVGAVTATGAAGGTDGADSDGASTSEASAERRNAASGDRWTGLGSGWPPSAWVGRATPTTMPLGASRLCPWDSGWSAAGGGLLPASASANGRAGATSGGGPIVSPSGGRRRQASLSPRGGEAPFPDWAASDPVGERCADRNGHGSRMLR
jgi:hypothetical protein